METGEPTQPTTEMLQYEQIHQMVAAEFPIEEGFIEYNTPTFYVTPQPNLKQAFLRLYKQLNSMQLVPILRKRENRITLQVIPKPPTKPSRPLINLILLVATIGTTLITGYFLFETMPNPWIGAIMFSIAVMSIMGAHEMGHKLTANRHKIEATYPYFIPGTPPWGTFGAVIQQKSLPPNRDALFDLGLSGPIIGFIATTVVLIIGTLISNVRIVQELPSGSFPLPLLLDFLVNMLIKLPPILPGDYVLIELHPLTYAGIIGMVVTMLNLMPVGQLDGGHITHVLLGEKTRLVVSFIAIIALVLTGFWLMAILALLIARIPHPDPLDGVSKLSTSRKIAAVLVIVIFVLCVLSIPPQLLF